MAYGVCVRCGEETSVLKSRRLDVVCVPENRMERCLVFQCPKCDAVLGCQLDLTAISEQLAQGVIAALRRQGHDDGQ